MSIAITQTRMPRLALVLGLAALIPLVASLAAAWTASEPGLQSAARQAGPIYAALLLSLLGGVRWGAVLGPVSPRYANRDFILGLVPAFIGWAALTLQPELALCLLLSALLTQAFWDVLAVEAGRLPYWYGKLRMIIAGGATIAILAMLGERLFR